MGARDMRNACRSVLATTNSIPSMPESIMRLTALFPPPPTPMTLILASLRVSSLKLMRMSFSFFMYAAFNGFFLLCPSLAFIRTLDRSAAVPAGKMPALPNTYAPLPTNMAFNLELQRSF